MATPGSRPREDRPEVHPEDHHEAGGDPEIRGEAAGGPDAAAAKVASKKRPAAGAARRVVTRASGEALRLAGVGTDAVAKATGKAWDQWLAILDKAGPSRCPTRRSRRCSRTSTACRRGGARWSPSATSRPAACGRRTRRATARGQRLAHAPREPGAPLRRVGGPGAARAVARRRAGRGEARHGGEIHAHHVGSGDSSVDVTFHPRGDGKSQVAVEHGKLRDRKAVDRQKGFWGGALDR